LLVDYCFSTITSRDPHILSFVIAGLDPAIPDEDLRNRP
jgi:hypothetical protein